MRAIKAVVFDYGKVICDPPPDGVMNEIASLAGVNRDIFEPLYKKHRGEYDRGKINVSGFYRIILEELANNYGFNCKIDEDKLSKMGELDMNSWKNINSQTVKLMEDIKKSGLILGILSNMPFDFLSYLRKNTGICSLPHVGIFSCESGFIKPEKAIYKKLIAAVGCMADELVFFDDVPENIEKALELGIVARIWQGSDRARRDLAGMGIRGIF